MKASSGFTVVELLVTIVFVGIVGTVFFDLYQSVQMTHRDQARKIAINSIYTNLEEVVKPTLHGYPRVLSASKLTAMDPSLLTDPNGVMIGKGNSDYHYEPTGCGGGDICAGYTLRADLERETDYTKSKP